MDSEDWLCTTDGNERVIQFNVTTSSLYRDVHELTASHRDFVFGKECEGIFKRVRRNEMTPEDAAATLATRMRWLMSPDFEAWSVQWCRDNVPKVWDGPPTGMPSDDKP